MSQYSKNEYINDSNHSWSILYNFIKPKTKILDIGCSSGNLGEGLIQKKGCVVDGVEQNPKDSDMARKKLRNVYSLNIETDDIGFIKEKYDYIVFADVIEHLVNPVSTLKRVKRLLNKNGKLVYSIPNMAHISIRLQLLAGNFIYTGTGLLDETHLHFYTRTNIQKMFLEASYEIKEQDYTQVNYPRGFLEKRFKELGLKMIEYKKYLQSDEANAFQFIGIAVPNEKPKSYNSPSINELPHTKDIVELNEYIEGMKSTIDIQNSHIEKQNLEVEQLKTVLSRVGHRWVAKIYKKLGR